MSVNFQGHPLFRGGSPFRAEIDLYDCEVEGDIPSDLNGTFYRVGPDYRYPPRLLNDIPFNGDGHVGMFRFSGGGVDFRSRYAQTQRYLAEKEAREALYGCYRNRYTDRPEVRELSGGTANTHVMYFNGKLMAFKEDSPPVWMDPETLETIDNFWTFDGQLESMTYTAHPKIDPKTGEFIGFGYEAKGEATQDINVFAIGPDGKQTWSAWVKCPYTCMIHDFAVTENFVGFLLIPYVVSVERLKAGEVHWAWDQTLPSYLGVMRRGGDGSDIQWMKAPTRCATHVMGTFNDGDMFYMDMDMGTSAQFPFFPFLNGHFDPPSAAGKITRLTVDMSSKTPSYNEEILYPDWGGALPRQDDRYNTQPYTFGIMPCGQYGGPNAIVTFNHAKRTSKAWMVPEGTKVNEPCFAPRSKDAPEGDGYIVAMASRLNEGGRNDLLVFDAQHVDEGPIAAVNLPFKAMGQIHGWWVPDWELKATPLEV